MPTISADVTESMKDWIKLKVELGDYKGTSDLMRTALREMMHKDRDYVRHWLPMQENIASKQLKHLKTLRKI